MGLPAQGREAGEVLAELDARKGLDVRWRDGRAFTLAYHASDEVYAVAQEAYRRFSSENALNVDAFPSLREMQAEVVEVANGWLDGGADAAGFMTSGGTESILLAVLGAREQGRAERGVERPNVVLPASAHAAFEKACHYFDLESRRIPVDGAWRADVDAMEQAIDDRTVLVVASAPQFPQGVIDPVTEVAALAAARGVNCHVDACMGGVTLPYLARLGLGVAPWNFAVEGVTSMSVDLHKYGYTAKGASVVMYRDRRLRRYQTYVTDNWLGGVYGSSGLLGTKSGGAIAAAWAVLQHVGDAGYLDLTRRARAAVVELADAIEATPDLVLRARPETTLLAFGAAEPDTLDVFAVADELWRRGWYVDRQGPPPSLHCMVNAVHEGRVSAFVDDLRQAVETVAGAGATGTSGVYGTVD